MKYAIHTTAVFDKWTANLKDRQAAMAQQCAWIELLMAIWVMLKVSARVCEMRIFIGLGYRIYFTVRNGEIIVLLCGGNKSTQQRDIKKAKELAKNL
jgi:putative addiction module killer protein